jgi:hypothetical protein
MRGYHVATPNTDERALVCSADRATAGRDDDEKSSRPVDGYLIDYAATSLTTSPALEARK